MEINNIYQGNCLEIMKLIDDNSIDSIITDPPYGISMMSKKWDKDVPTIEVWNEAYRILKPGAHMLVACGTRTFHRMVTRIEDAGFYPKDIIIWAYGSGMPKSLNISKAIDKELGCEREVVGLKMRPDGKTVLEARPNNFNGQLKEWHRPWMEDVDKVTLQASVTAPSSDLAKQYDGYGTQLKPAIEMFSLLQKPISEKTIAKNVMKWGTGGINIDKCRVKYQNDSDKNQALKGDAIKRKDFSDKKAYAREWMENPDRIKQYNIEAKQRGNLGRFPANLIIDDSQQVLDMFPVTKSGGGNKHPSSSKIYGRNSYNESATQGDNHVYEPDEGSASRFFYCAKSSPSEKNQGLSNEMKNIHPTVKPLKLMEYLVRLINPSNGVILDPFCGSGTTLVAAINEGFNYIGIELSQEYCNISQQRVNYAILNNKENKF